MRTCPYIVAVMITSACLLALVLSAQKIDFIDRYDSSVAAPYAAGDKKLQVASGRGLPAGACNFHIIVKRLVRPHDPPPPEEILRVTNVSGNLLTVEGAQGGTTAADHAVGDIVLAGGDIERHARGK